MEHFIGVGACYVDTILSSSRTKVPDEAADLQINLVGVLPNLFTPASRDLQASYGTENVPRHCIYREDEAKSARRYIIRNVSTSSITIIDHNQLRDMTFAEFKKVADTLGAKTAWCHFEGRKPDVTLKCMKYVRRKYPGVKISVELDEHATEGLQDLALHAEVVFFSTSWALGKGYPDARSCLHSQSSVAKQASLLFCTWGDEDAWAYEPLGQEWSHVPAYRVENARIVDTIGAGDGFIAGILYGQIFRSKDWSLEYKLRFANQLAGRKILQEGFAGLGEVTEGE